MEKNEKIIEKIKKVLELSKNNPSEEEAKAAALKAQRMLAEYHLTMKDVEDIEEIDEITEVMVHVGMGNKWKVILANTVARNFRCKNFYHGKDNMVFYGYQVDAETAANTFKFLFDFGIKAANRYYYRAKRDGQQTHGVKNGFYVGYLNGITLEMEQQSTALMLVTPQPVLESYKQLTQGFKTSQCTIRYSGNDAGRLAREEGERVGRSVAQARNIEKKKAI